MSQSLDLIYKLVILLDNKKYEEVLKILSYKLNAETAFLLNYYEYQSSADILVGYNVKNEFNEYLKNLDIKKLFSLKKELSKGLPVIINDIEKVNQFLELKKILIDRNKKSVVLVPIRDNEKNIIGILGLVNKEKSEWKEDDIKILEVLTYNLKYNWEDEILRLKYKSIIQNSASAIVIIDINGRIVESNNKFEKLSKTPNNELENRYFFEFVHEIDRDKLIKRHQKRKKGLNVKSDYDFKFIDSNNKIKDINIKVKIIPGTDKTICSLVDITEKRKNKNLIKIQEKKLNESYNQLKKSRDKLKSTYLDLIDKNIENEKLINNIERLINLMSSLCITNNNIDKFLSDLLYTALELVEVADYGSVYIFDQKENIKYIDTIGHNLEKLNELKLKKKEFQHSKEKVKIINDILEKNRNNMDDELLNELKKYTLPIKQSMTVALRNKNNEFGGISIDIAESSNNSFKEDDIRLLSSFKDLANTFFKLKKYKKLNKTFNKEIVSSLLNFLSIYDLYTNNHSENVAKLSLKIADKLGLKEELKNDTYWTGMLHDMGKLIIPSNILNKKGKLTQKEYKTIQKHPVYCYKALIKSEFLKDIAQYVLHHHERWDGKGYPKGLQGDEIPLVSRIIATADAWDAMRSKRAYRDSLSIDEAKEEIIKNIGKQFDPRIAEILLEIVEN